MMREVVYINQNKSYIRTRFKGLTNVKYLQRSFKISLEVNGLELSWHLIFVLCVVGKLFALFLSLNGNEEMTTVAHVNQCQCGEMGHYLHLCH